MAKIFITRPIPGNPKKMLEDAGHQVDVNPNNSALSHDELIVTLKNGNYDGAVTLLHDDINSEVFDAVPRVKIYANYAVGYNNIDIEEAKKRGITVTNTPCDSVNESVAEHTFAMILSLASRIPEGDKFVREGKYSGWDPNLLIGTDIKGKTLGVIGAGRIGTFVIEKAARGFGMNVIYYDIIRNERVEKEFGAKFTDSLDELLKTSDIVTLHVPLLGSTKHIMSAEKIALMKSDSYLINTSRGAVVDEKALCEALKNNRIKGAAIDVYEFEPKITEGLLELSNIILTPHIASSTERTRFEMTRIAVENVCDFFQGKKPKNSVF